MTDDTGRAADSGGAARTAFTLVARVTHWNPIARELTIGGRVLQVAASVLFSPDVVAGVNVIASGYQPSDPSDRWIVTRLQVG